MLSNFLIFQNLSDWNTFFFNLCFAITESYDQPKDMQFANETRLLLVLAISAQGRKQKKISVYIF